MKLHQTQVADFHLELVPSGTLPQAILGDTWIAVAAEAQFAASMSVAASTDAGIANAAVLLLLYKFGFLLVTESHQTPADQMMR